MKKYLIALVLVAALFITGCTTKEKNIEGKLDDLMTKVYEGIKEDELPMGLTNISLTSENIQNFIGTKDIAYKEAVASESMVGSIAHSIVLIRMDEKADIEKAKEEIKSKVDPRKWICVEAENVIVESKGNLIILIMTGEHAKTIQTNFQNLK